MKGLQGRRAEPPFRQVDDAFERQVVVGLGDDAQIGDGVADFLALVKPRPADDPVGNAQRNQAFLELAGLEPGSDQHRDPVQGLFLGL